jgi:hypothetical protein
MESIQPPNIAAVLILAVPVASIAWAVTHEEIFREPREWCADRSQSATRLIARKFFYLFTCEYCFSHWVTMALLAVTRFRLLYDDWRGYVVAGFTLVWIANMYMAVYARLRLDLRSERLQIRTLEAEVASIAPDVERDPKAERRES